jgi:hypothetical protein
MAYTVGTVVTDGIYRLNTTLRDQIDEEIRKVSRLHNPGTGDNVEDAMQAFEALTDAALVGTSASITVPITGASTTIGTSGDFSYVKEVIVLTFTRAHPLNAAKVVKQTWAIPAPVQAIYTGVTINIGTDPGDFASAGGVTETLARLIGWLEDHLIYEDITGAITVGGWTYQPGMSGIISQPRILDGVPNT